MDENTNPLKNASLYVGLVVIAVMVLLTFGAYKIYQARTNKTTTIVQQSPKPTGTPAAKANSQLPTPTASPSPVLGAAVAIPQTQPDSGSESQKVNGMGISIISPSQNQTVSSQIKVTGMANVLGDLLILVKDSKENILVSTTANACLGPNACPFAVVVSFQMATTPNGTTEVSSPQDSPSYTQIVSVKF